VAMAVAVVATATVLLVVVAAAVVVEVEAHAEAVVALAAAAEDVDVVEVVVVVAASPSQPRISMPSWIALSKRVAAAAVVVVVQQRAARPSIQSMLVNQPCLQNPSAAVLWRMLQLKSPPRFLFEYLYEECRFFLFESKI